MDKIALDNKHGGPVFGWWMRMLVIAIATSAMAWGALHLADSGRERWVAGQMDQMRRDASIMAGIFGKAVARYETPGFDGKARQMIDVDRAALLAAQVAVPGMRLLLFDTAGRLVGDSGPPVEEKGTPVAQSQLQLAYQDFADWLIDGLSMEARAADTQIFTYFSEARDALRGAPAERVELQDDGSSQLVVAMPVWSEDSLIGALVVTSMAPGFTLRSREGLTGAGAAVVIGIMGLGLFWMLMVLPLRRNIAAVGEAIDGLADRTSAAMPSLTGPGRLLAPVADATARVGAMLQARIAEEELHARELAHEVKNPLASLRSAVETAANIDDPEQHRRLMEVIAQDVVRLDRLISAITDLGQVDAELATMPDEVVDLEGMLATLIELDEAAHPEEPAVRFQLLGGGGPYCIYGAEDRLAQVFRNLIGNARSFSPPGGRVRFALSRSRGMITVTCEDDGPGVPPGKEAAIFQRFYSERSDRDPSANHFGLGLSLCRQIVQAHRGTIRAENRLGPSGQVIGARFIIVVPSV